MLSIRRCRVSPTPLMRHRSSSFKRCSGGFQGVRGAVSHPEGLTHKTPVQIGLYAHTLVRTALPLVIDRGCDSCLPPPPSRRWCSEGMQWMRPSASLCRCATYSGRLACAQILTAADSIGVRGFLCRILDGDFGEFIFQALEWIGLLWERVRGAQRARAHRSRTAARIKVCFRAALGWPCPLAPPR